MKPLMFIRSITNARPSLAVEYNQPGELLLIAFKEGPIARKTDAVAGETDVLPKPAPAQATSGCLLAEAKDFAIGCLSDDPALAPVGLAGGPVA